jgi:hypothetical protein
LWYSRGQNFDYTSDLIQNAEPFTQLVWKRSKEIGIGMSHRDQFNYVVVFYFPAGNTDRVIENVLPPV